MILETVETISIYNMSIATVVIKLGVLKEGDTVFRRLTFDQLGASLTASAKIQTLKRVAVSIFRGNEDLKDFSEEYTVTLFYRDLENDKVLIWSDADLNNAMHEYQSQGRVKILAEVSEVEKTNTNTNDDTAESESTTKSTQTTSEKGNVVDSIADLLSVVAVSVEAGIHAASKQAKKVVSKEQLKIAKQASKESVKFSKEQFKVAKQVSKESYKASKEQFKQARKSVRIVVKDSVTGLGPVAVVSQVAAKEPTVAKDSSAADDAKETPAATADVAKESPAADVKDSAAAVPFIHGRHTCDLCLTTPIIGKRFHATNMLDYDLCEACHGNYKGSEILFEEATLERDSPFQDRWNRKKRMQQSMNNKKCGPMRRAPNGRHVGPYRHPAFAGPPPPFAPNVRAGHRHNCFGPPTPHFGPPPHHGPHPHPFGPHPHHGPHSHPFGPHPPHSRGDVAMEEAIRRSLQDVVGLSGQDEVEATDEPDIVVELVDQEATEKTSEDAKSKYAPVAADDEETFSDCKEEPEDDLTLAVEKPSSVEFAVEEKEDVKKTSVEVETVNEGDEIPAEESFAGKDASFASEAADSGDIATFVGETLDRMGEAIERLNSEFSKDVEEEDSVDDDDDSGAMIVDGEEHDDAVSESSWSVVVEEEQSVVDEGIARATQAIGSALFNSDMRSSENVSAMTHSIAESSSSSSSSSSSETNFSSVASVPTTVRSVVTTEVPQQLLNRYAVQLEKLHELGFLNDALCVEVLEGLAAANIGVDSEDEVSVQQVVDKLMKEW